MMLGASDGDGDNGNDVDNNDDDDDDTVDDWSMGSGVAGDDDVVVDIIIVDGTRVSIVALSI